MHASVTTEFRILGPLTVVHAGQTRAVEGAKQRALLALLLLRPGEVVSADRLLEALWPRDPPGDRANSLQSLVSRQRRSIGEGAELAFQT